MKRLFERTRSKADTLMVDGEEQYVFEHHLRSKRHRGVLVEDLKEFLGNGMGLLGAQEEFWPVLMIHKVFRVSLATDRYISRPSSPSN